MTKFAVINFKVDPELKEQAIKIASRLGTSVSEVLNSELRRFVAEQSVLPEIPNSETDRQLTLAADEITRGDYHKFDSNEKALNFL